MHVEFGKNIIFVTLCRFVFKQNGFVFRSNMRVMSPKPLHQSHVLISHDMECLKMTRIAPLDGLSFSASV